VYNYNQRIEVDEDVKDIISITTSDGNWPIGDRSTGDGYTDFEHLSIFKKDLPELIRKLQGFLE